LTKEVERRRRHRLGIALTCVSVLLLFAVGALWSTLQEEKQADKAAARARIEEDRSWIEGAKLSSARGDHFAVALMAARALGFAGYSREKIAGASLSGVANSLVALEEFWAGGAGQLNPPRRSRINPGRVERGY
jgi:hypothetical protein